MFSGSSVSFGRCRLRGPIAVSELMHFFHATHQSINDPSRADRLESASFNRPLKRIKTEAAFAPPVASTPQAQIQYTQQSQAQSIRIVVKSQDGCEVQFGESELEDGDIIDSLSLMLGD
ncbi:TPA: hypothetical protein ACH3X3_009568 [Trebouxia sp. C0006]